MPVCTGAILQVTNTADSGAGSLRQAISDANATPGTNTITFNIPGPGAPTISLLTQLPVITNAVNIDGTTQPGYLGTPLIALNGNSLFGSACGLVIASGGNSVRALTIQRFKFNAATGHGILIQGGGGNVVAGCFIGTDTNGIAQQFNSGCGIWISNSVNNVIGGTNAADRNLLSGNSVCGVLISGGGATGNQVLGNIIGLGIAGTNAVGNNRGVIISNAPNNIIGGVVPGARNVISGQFDHEIVVTGLGATGNVIEGNYIGVRSDGAALSANNANFDGVSVNNAPSNTIGGIVTGARNILSGNNNGITLLGSNTIGNVIQGNYIGTDPSGSVKIPNHEGILVTALNGGFSLSNTIGGAVSGAGNLISGNKTYGLGINASAGNTVQGNFIGTDATGMIALGNGASGTGGGMSVSGSGNIIGGSAPGAGNVISGNPSDGLDIVVASVSDLSVNNLVQGNLIGVAANGVSPLGNGLVGVGGRGLSVLGANSNLIGGFSAGAGNMIANNGYDGVWMVGAFGAFGTPGTNNLVAGNTIYSNGAVVVAQGGTAAGVSLLGPNVVSSNSIYANTYLGIDNGADGPTANTPQGHSNYPLLTLVRLGSTEIDGVMNGTPGCVYTIEFYENNPGLTLIYGAQGQIFLGDIVVPPGPFHASFFQRATEGDDITAIATAHCSPRETSEFSFSFKVTLTPQAPPALGTGLPVGGDFEASVKSTNGENIVIKSTTDLSTPMGLWETILMLAAGTTNADLGSVFDAPSIFFRATDSGGAVGNVQATFVDSNNVPMAGAPVQIGRLEMPIFADANGVVRNDGYPAGPTKVVLNKQTTVTVNGSSVTYSNKLAILVNVNANIVNLMVLKAALAADTNPPPPVCLCTPWCGVMGGTVGGVQKVSAAGGANGTCGGTPQVTLTGPGIAGQLTLIPGKEIQIDPAQDGTWTVTSTVCGTTKSVQITLP